jgi:peptidoglycan DL-endopeptidase CwlO
VATRADYVAFAVQAAQQHGFPPDVMVAQLDQESGFNPDARSSAGAEGIAQFEPATAAGLGVDPWDPWQAIDGMARLDADNLSRFGSVELALAAYDAGGGAVQQYGGIPPFAETQRYVRDILAAAGGVQLGDVVVASAPDGVPTSAQTEPQVSPWLVLGGVALVLWAIGEL